MSKKLLLIIDAQYDFMSQGSLACANADIQMDRLADYLKKIKGNNTYTDIVATVDWHPMDHCSFEKNGGIFPVHCLANSQGAAIYQPILEACYDCDSDFFVFTKGTDPDHEQFSIVKNGQSWGVIKALIKASEVEEIDICGIASEYCVRDTIIDIHKELPHIKINALVPFIGHLSADGEENFIKWAETEHPSTNIVKEA